MQYLGSTLCLASLPLLSQACSGAQAFRHECMDTFLLPVVVACTEIASTITALLTSSPGSPSFHNQHLKGCYPANVHEYFGKHNRFKICSCRIVLYSCAIKGSNFIDFIYNYADISPRFISIACSLSGCTVIRLFMVFRLRKVTPLFM